MPLWHSAFPTAEGYKKSARKPEPVKSFIQTRWLSLVHIVIHFFMFKPGPSTEHLCINFRHTHKSSRIPSVIFGESPIIGRKLLIPKGLTIISLLFKTNTSKMIIPHDLSPHKATVCHWVLKSNQANLYGHLVFWVWFLKSYRFSFLL